MKQKSYYSSIALMVLCFYLFGCNSVNLRVEPSDGGIREDGSRHYVADAYGTFWNLENTSIQKSARGAKDSSTDSNFNAKFRITNGTDFIGKKSNYAVVYHITYWDSFLAVITIGLYVPLRIEYYPAKQ